MLKDNGRDTNYVPSPTVSAWLRKDIRSSQGTNEAFECLQLVSFTDGSGLYGYTNLTAENYSTARALADASNVLPYLVGTGKLVAQQYADKVISAAFIDVIQLAIVLGIVFAMGVISAIFLPRLPLDVPHRGFGLYSWLSAFYADELQPAPDSRVEISKRMELKDIVQYTSELRFRFVIPTQ